MSALHRCVPSIVAFLSLFAAVNHAAAQEAPLSRARVIELAREAPAARVAALEEHVAAAVVAAAGSLSLENPVVSGLGGVRVNPSGSKSFAGAATLSWPIDLGGRRGARVNAARAEERAASAGKDDTRRRLLLGALLQHALILRDERQIAVARARLVLTQRFLDASKRRQTAGAVPELDVTLAALQERQDAALQADAVSARDADKTLLLAVLGLPQTNPPVGGPLVPEGQVPDLATLLRELPERTDIRAALASAEAAAAVAERERSARFPTFSVLAQYVRDDGANIGQIGFAAPLPILNANDVNVAQSRAELGVANARADAAQAAASGEVRTLHARYQGTRRALDALEPSAALTERAVELATRAYELGEADLASVLLVRREALAAQLALLEAEHAHANAKIELLVASGRLPQ